MTKIIPIPKCYVGYFLWLVVFICNGYSIYWFVTSQHVNDQIVDKNFYMICCIFGTIGNAIFTAIAIRDLNRRHHFIRWYGIGFKLVPCENPRPRSDHEHEWDFTTIVDGKVICRNFKCVEKRNLTPEELEKYVRNN